MFHCTTELLQSTNHITSLSSHSNPDLPKKPFRMLMPSYTRIHTKKPSSSVGWAGPIVIIATQFWEAEKNNSKPSSGTLNQLPERPSRFSQNRGSWGDLGSCLGLCRTWHCSVIRSLESGIHTAFMWHAFSWGSRQCGMQWELANACCWFKVLEHLETEKKSTKLLSGEQFGDWKVAIVFE